MCIVHRGQLLFVTSLSVRFSGWIPAGTVTECLPGLDKITNCLIRQEKEEAISKSGHFGSAPSRTAEFQKSVLHINDVVCPGVDQRHLFESQEASWPLPTLNSQCV